MYINLGELLKGEYTYRTRSGYNHKIRTKLINKNEVMVFYRITGKINRKISRIFPRYINLNKRLIWAIGFINGEGLKSINPKSSMYRFAVTNNDPKLIKRVLHVLYESKLIKDRELPPNCIKINYGRNCNTLALKKYWCTQLDLEEEKIKIASNSQKEKKATYGTATLYLSDVLLRRVIDLIGEYITKQIFPN